VVEAVYANREIAPVSVQTRAALKLVETMTLRPGELGPADINEVRAAGVSDEAIVDAAHVCALFNLIDRLADSFGWHVPDQEAFDVSAKVLLKMGYDVPGPVRWLARD
jgi:alkylhydroperoxidase family enzyme